jgi:hypothetical protein
MNLTNVMKHFMNVIAAFTFLGSFQSNDCLFSYAVSFKECFSFRYLVLVLIFISVILNIAFQAATPFPNIAMFECLCPSLMLNNLSC